MPDKLFATSQQLFSTIISIECGSFVPTEDQVKRWAGEEEVAAYKWRDTKAQYRICTDNLNKLVSFGLRVGKEIATICANGGRDK